MKERKKGKERGFHQSGLMFIKGKKKKASSRQYGGEREFLIQTPGRTRTLPFTSYPSCFSVTWSPCP